MEADALYILGFALIFAGVLILLVAILSLFISSVKKQKIKGAGAIIIGPFPIVFGTDKESIKEVLLLSIILTILFLILTVIFCLVLK